MAGRVDPSRDLRLGLRALEGRVIDREQLVAAVADWASSSGRTLAEILVGAVALVDVPTLARLEEQVAADLESSRDDRRDDPDATMTVAFTGSSHDGGPRRHGDRGRAFRVLRPHARGGLGEVFVAFDRELNRTGRPQGVAARLAHDPASQARFLLEAEVTGSLEHPGIVPVYSLGRYADGRPYYAMHLVQGETLRDAIERFHRAGRRRRGAEGRELAFRRLLRSVIDACNAVAYAHSRGVVHRDLKPENIMLGRFGETLVVDWGVAKVLSRTARTRRPTRPSPSLRGRRVDDPARLGDRHAAVHEPRAGRGRPRTGSAPASDVYSLGAILYCVLVGHGPFPDGDMPDVLDRVRRGIFPAPRRLRRSVDPALEAICLKAMALDPRGPPRLGARPGQRARDLAGRRPLSRRARARPEPGQGLAGPALPRAGPQLLRPGGARRGDALAGARPRERPDRPARPRARHPDEPRAAGTSGRSCWSGACRHAGEVHAVAFCPEGRRLATACGDRDGPALGHLHRLDPLAPLEARRARPRRRLQPRRDDRRDGGRRRDDPALGCRDRRARRRAHPRGAPVLALGFSPDGSRIAATSEPASPSSGTPRRASRSASRTGAARASWRSPSPRTARRVAVACDDGVVYLRERRDRQSARRAPRSRVGCPRLASIPAAGGC